MPKWRWPISRKWTIRLGAGGLALLLVGLIGLWCIGQILGHKLIGLLGERLNAQVSAGGFYYLPPYGLLAKDCRVVVRDADGTAYDLLEIQSLRVALAEAPVHGGPLIIQDLTVRQPVIHLIRTIQGLEGETGLVKPPPPGTDNAGKPKHKLSEILRLRHVSIIGGQVIYEDRTLPEPSPMKWSGIDVHIETSPKGPADYDFNFTGANAGLADFVANGQINVDDRRALIEHFLLSAHPSEDRFASELPPQLASALAKHRVQGNLKIEGSAAADLLESSRDQLDAVLTLAEARAFSPELNAWLDQLHFSLKLGADFAGLSAIVSNFAAHSGNATLSIRDGLSVFIDRSNGVWSIKKLEGTLAVARGGDTRPSEIRASDPRGADSRGIVSHMADTRGVLRYINPDGSLEFTAAFAGPITRSPHWKDVQGELLIYPRKLSIQPRDFPQPISDVGGGPIRVAGGVAAVKDLLGHYGGDQLLITSARLALPPLKTGQMHWSEIAATMVFGDSLQQYPPPLADILQLAQPGGEFAASGRFDADFNQPRPALDYDLLVSCDHASAKVMDVQVKQIKADAELFTDHLQLGRLDCQTLGGTISGQGRVGTRAPFAFAGDVFTHRLSVLQVAHLLKVKQSDQMNLQGLADMQASVGGAIGNGDSSVIDLLTAQGHVEVYDGNFWDAPAMRKIVQIASVTREALTVGQAAALFRVAGRRIELQNAVISAPALGLQGNGFVGFDGKLDLHVIAAPLADWRKKLKSTGIPVLSDVVGNVAGTVQNALNSATGSLFYDIRVTGDTTNPQVNTVPSPILTEGATKMFRNMLDLKQGSSPLQLLQKDSNSQAPR